MIPGQVRLSLDDMDMDNWISPAEVFGALFARPGQPRTPASTPAETSEQATAVANKNAFEVKLNVVDYKPETLNVTVSNGVITVEGKHEETKTEKDEQGNEVISEEFVSRRFKRMYTLPTNAIEEQLECKFTADGHLLLSAPLKAIEAAPEQPAVRSIPINRNAEVEGEAPVVTAPAENGEPMSNESTEPEPAPMDSEKTNN